jgi:hypothetical protein
MALGDDQHAADLDTYLLKNLRFRSLVYDHREIRCIADNLGFNPDHVCTGLRKLGYCLIQNNHGSHGLEKRCGVHMRARHRIDAWLF